MSGGDAAAVDPAVIRQAVAVLRNGGIIAYPTEGVFGLGCDPLDEQACARLAALKRRSTQQGVLLVASDFEQLRPWLGKTSDAALQRALATWPGPDTWVFARADDAPAWIAGRQAGIGVRVTAHPVAAALCREFGGALVSTSANRHGRPPARDAATVRAELGDALDFIVDAPVGQLARPTPITDAASGKRLRD